MKKPTLSSGSTTRALSRTLTSESKATPWRPRRKKLSDQRAQAIHGSKALETLDKLRELQRQLDTLPEFPWEFGH